MRKIIGFVVVGIAAATVSLWALTSNSSNESHCTASCCAATGACACTCAGDPAACECPSGCSCTACGTGCCASH